MTCASGRGPPRGRPRGEQAGHEAALADRRVEGPPSRRSSLVKSTTRMEFLAALVG